MQAVAGAEPIVAWIVGAAFALAGLAMLLRPRPETRAALVFAGLAVFLVGAGFLALPWLAGEPEPAPAPARPEPEPVAAAPGGIALSADGRRTVALAAPRRAPPPLPGRPAARIEIEASEAEPNDNIAAANRAELGTAIGGALTEGDLDYFAVDAPIERRSEIVATLVLPRGDASLTVFDDAGVALGTAVTRTGLGIHAITLARKADRRRYHLLVMAIAPEATDYRLTIARREP